MNNTPKLRFKEFSREWEIKKLGELGAFFKGSTLSKANLSEDGKPCVLYGELYTKYREVIKSISSKTNLDDSKLIIGNKNDVLIPSSGESAIDIATASCLQQDDVILGGDLNVFRSDKLNGVFTSYQLNTSKKNEIAKLAQGASVVHIYNTQLSKLKLNVPKLEEQEKIASFFSLIDDKISLQGEMVEALKVYKKGMMQKIFNRELRFKDDDGRDYPEWEEKKLGDLFNIKAGGDIKSNNVSKEMTEKNIYPVYANALNNKGLYGYTDTFKVEGDTITVTGRGDIGYAIARNDKYYPIVRLLVLSPLDKLNIIYFENIINFTNIFIESTGVPQLTSPQLSQVKVRVPIFEEQEKIAKLLKNIDNKIEKEKEKLDSLNEYKKGLLQQMFV